MPLPPDLVAVAWLAVDDISRRYGLDVEAGRSLASVAMGARAEFEAVTQAVNHLLEIATPEEIDRLVAYFEETEVT